MEERRIHRFSLWFGIGTGVVFGLLPFVVQQMSQQLAWAGIGLGFLCMLYGIWPVAEPHLRRLMPKLEPAPVEDEIGRTVAPAQEDEYLTLTEAARKALEAIDGSILSAVARRAFSSPNGAICFMAERLFMNEMPVYGKRVPSSVEARISDELLFSDQFVNDASIAVDKYTHQPTYVDLRVKRADLNEVISELKARHPLVSN